MMWPRVCFLAVCAVLCMEGVSSFDSPGLAADAVRGKLNVTPDKQEIPAPDSGKIAREDDHGSKATDDVTREEKLDNSCKEIPTTESGKYEIQFGLNKTRLLVYCEQTAFGGGWIVFQHRMNGSVNFYRKWADYREGFGSLDGEFWLGLESLHQLTSARPHELMVEIRDYQGNYGYAHYDRFAIGSESEGYNLTIGTYNGTAGDSLKFSSDAKYSTKDKEKEPSSFLHCAVHLQGAWWYNDCSQSNLNGIYGNLVDRDWIGMHWQGLKKDYSSMSYSRMMVREVN